MGSKHSVLPEPLLKIQNVSCLTYEENTKKPYKDNLCLSRALALHLHGNERLEEEVTTIFNLSLNSCGEADPSKFQGVHMTHIPKVEMSQLNFFPYDIDFVDGKLLGELARRTFQKFEKSVKFLRYSNQICYLSNMNSFFKSLRCSTCDKIFSKDGNLERQLITCSERVKYNSPKNVHQSRETIFEKIRFFQYSIQRGSKIV